MVLVRSNTALPIHQSSQGTASNTATCTSPRTSDTYPVHGCAFQGCHMTLPKPTPAMLVASAALRGGCVVLVKWPWTCSWYSPHPTAFASPSDALQTLACSRLRSQTLLMDEPAGETFSILPMVIQTPFSTMHAHFRLPLMPTLLSLSIVPPLAVMTPKLIFLLMLKQALNVLTSTLGDVRAGLAMGGQAASSAALLQKHPVLLSIQRLSCPCVICLRPQHTNQGNKTKTRGKTGR